MSNLIYVPITPAGTPMESLSSPVEIVAIRNLLKEAKHMPYKGWKAFQRRGCMIEKWEGSDE